MAKRKRVRQVKRKNGTVAEVRSGLVRERALAEIERLHLQGFNQTQIAGMVGVSQQQVSYDLSTIKKKWMETTVATRQQLVEEKLRQLALVRATAWQAFQRSCAPPPPKVTDGDGDGQSATDGDDGRQEAAPGRMRPGANEFLMTVLKTVEQERELLGLDEAKKVDMTGRVMTLDYGQLLGLYGREDVPDEVEDRLEAEARRLGLRDG